MKNTSRAFAEMKMDRREALRRLGLAGGAAATAPKAAEALQEAGLHAAPNVPPPPREFGSALPPDPRLVSKSWKPIFFDQHQNQTVIVLSDLIIPETDTPGAKAAQVNRFLDLWLAAESAKNQTAYIQALSWLDGYCLRKYNGPFTALNLEEMDGLLNLLTHPNQNSELSHGIELFGILKSSIVQAYYTSEVGMLEELKYQTNPFQSAFPRCKGQPNYQKVSRLKQELKDGRSRPQRIS
jgi:glucoside 3-dehydrogenase (cytochrome c) hitch-hiker subunit